MSELPDLPERASFLRVPGEEQPAGYAVATAAAAAALILRGSAMIGSPLGKGASDLVPVTDADWSNMALALLLNGVCRQEDWGCPRWFCAQPSLGFLHSPPGHRFGLRRSLVPAPCSPQVAA